jgi:hypothetical protein
LGAIRFQLSAVAKGISIISAPLCVPCLPPSGRDVSPDLSDSDLEHSVVRSNFTNPDENREWAQKDARKKLEPLMKPLRPEKYL